MRPHSGHVSLILAFPFRSSELRFCTADLFARNEDGKAFGFDLEMMTFDEVSIVYKVRFSLIYFCVPLFCVPQRSQTISESASCEVDKRLPQAVQNNRDPIAAIFAVMKALSTLPQQLWRFSEGSAGNSSSTPQVAL